MNPDTDNNEIRAFAVDPATEKRLNEALTGRGARGQRGDIQPALKTLANSASPRYTRWSNDEVKDLPDVRTTVIDD